MSTAPTPQRDVATLLVEAFPVAIIRRLDSARYASLGAPERAAIRLEAAACERTRGAATGASAAPPAELAPITPELAARHRATLEAELDRLARNPGGDHV